MKLKDKLCHELDGGGNLIYSFYGEEDVNKAVLEFRNWICEYMNEYETYEVTAEEVFEVFISIFGDFKNGK